MSAGKYKKPISLFRKINDEERAYMQKQLLAPTYRNFLQAVARNRAMKVEALMPFAEGKVYVGNDPQIQGVLVDRVSSIYALKKQLQDAAGHPIHFVDILPKDKWDMLKNKIEFKINLDPHIGDTTPAVR